MFDSKLSEAIHLIQKHYQEYGIMKPNIIINLHDSSNPNLTHDMAKKIIEKDSKIINGSVRLSPGEGIDTYIADNHASRVSIWAYYENDTEKELYLKLKEKYEGVIK